MTEYSDDTPPTGEYALDEIREGRRRTDRIAWHVAEFRAQLVALEDRYKELGRQQERMAQKVDKLHSRLLIVAAAAAGGGGVAGPWLETLLKTLGG